MQKEKKIKCCFTLTPTDYQKLKSFCHDVGFSMSGVIAALINGAMPKAKPDQAFWQKMNELYRIHDNIKNNTTDTVILSACKELEQWILDFQAAITAPEAGRKL